MVQIPPGGHSMEAVGARKEVPAFALLARSPACSLLSPKSWSRPIKERELVPRRHSTLQILCVATCAICGRSLCRTWSGCIHVCELELSPLPFDLAPRMPARHALFLAPAPEEPHGHQTGGCRALFAFPPSHMAGTGQG